MSPRSLQNRPLADLSVVGHASAAERTGQPVDASPNPVHTKLPLVHVQLAFDAKVGHGARYVHTWPSRLQLVLPTAAKVAGQAGCARVGPPSAVDGVAELHAGRARTAERAAAWKLLRVGPTSIPDLYQHPRAQL